MVDLVCAIVVLLFAYLGWRRGFVRSVLPLCGFGVGYLAAWLFYRPVGKVVGALFDLQPLLSYPLGAAVAFLIAVLLFNLAALLVRRWTAGRRPREDSLDLANRIGGVAVGGAYGVVVVLLAAWALLSLQALLVESHPDGFGPQIRGTLVGRLATPLAERVARVVAGGQTGSSTVEQTAASFARDPLRTSRDLTGVLSHRRVQAVLKDKRLMRQLARDPEGAARAPKVRALARDRELLEKLQRLGLVQAPEAGELPPEEVVRQVTERLKPAARLVEQLARDPEVQGLLQDPELQKRLEQRDLVALANDPKFNRLMEIVADRLRAEGRGAAPPRAERSDQ
jgi:uncharacterized membrane protein required for colicin V production